MNKKLHDVLSYNWKSTINYKRFPHLYQIGKGEQGVLICQPYKNEILPYWRFKTPLLARKSANKIYSLFLNYLNNNDFPGADMARKYLQMGFTRSRRYANYKGGRKYETKSKAHLTKGTGDKMKVQSANLFYIMWQRAENNKRYKQQKLIWKQTHG